MSSGTEAFAPKPTFSLVRVMLALALAFVVAGVWFAVKSVEWNQEARQKEPALRAQMGLGTQSAATAMRLDNQFADADGDLVADTPKDTAQQVSPDKLTFSFIAGPEAEHDRANWKEFVQFLSQRIGKPVEMVMFKTTEEQIQALKDGKLHVTGFNTGAVPLAVNAAGFVPLCTHGGQDGKFSDAMQIIVRADSPIRDKHLEDLKGHTVVFTDRTSNSGYKAAVVFLKSQHNLEPLRDYNLRFSTGHNESIKGIALGEYQVGPVSREMLNRAVAKGDASMEKLRVVYESERFPPATLGYAYNLSPDLAEKIQAAFLEFPWAGSGLEKQFAGSGSAKFVPVAYKHDFALICRNADAVQDPPDAVEEEVSVETRSQ